MTAPAPEYWLLVDPQRSIPKHLLAIRRFLRMAEEARRDGRPREEQFEDSGVLYEVHLDARGVGHVAPKGRDSVATMVKM